MAFKKVFKDPLTSSTNGSFTGNLSDPQSTVCSMICGTPVLSDGGVRKPMQNTLLLSSLLMRNIFAPVFLCSKIIPSEFSSGICFTCRSRYASRALTDSIWLSISECPFCCALGYSCNRIAPHFVLPRLRSAPVGADHVPPAHSTLKNIRNPLIFSAKKWLLTHVFGGSQGHALSCRQACVGFLTLMPLFTYFPQIYLLISQNTL